MSFTSEYFQINGINSSDIGVDGCYLIRTNSEINYPIFGGKEIIEEQNPYRDMPYHYYVKKQPIEFDLMFSLLDKEIDENRIYELGLIFAQDKYVEFRSCDFMGKIFYVLCTSMNLITYGSKKGWLQCHLRNSAPYAFSEIMINTFDLSDISTTPTLITMENKSNVTNQHGEYKYYPELEILLVGNVTGFSFYNLSDGNRGFGFSGLTKGETIYINNQKQQIISDIGETTYRLSKMLFSKNFFYLIYGENRISINCSGGTGGIILQSKCQFPIYM
ncbi:MAG: phage tail family protein [Tissierellia bacterium]|nr:phage tail family protein [Tissierellia bacterium]